MNLHLTGSSLLVLIVALPMTATAFQDAPQFGVVQLDDSLGSKTGTPEYVGHNGTNEARWMRLFTPEFPDQDRTFNVTVYNSNHNRVGFYGMTPEGEYVEVPADGYVVVEDDVDQDDADVVVGWEWY